MWKKHITEMCGLLLVLFGSLTAATLPERFDIAGDTVAAGKARFEQTEPAKPKVPAYYNVPQNYPNPFNAETTIEYALPQQSGVYITIYNLIGQHICTLKNDIEDAGYHKVVWNGTSGSGSSVSSGIYFYRVLADDFYAIRKMIVLK